MHIGVVADTHDHLPESVLQGLAGVDEIWHLGDVTQPQILDQFLALGVPVHVVRGNCDMEGSWPLVLNLTRAGVRFRLQHIPPRSAPENTDVLLHGHTHVPRDIRMGHVRMLNPGAVGKANKGAAAGYAVLSIQADGTLIWEQRGIKG